MKLRYLILGMFFGLATAQADLTLAQKSLVYSEDLTGNPVGGGSNPTRNRPGTMNQCILSIKYGDFLASSGAGFGGYSCAISRGLAAVKGYKLEDLPQAVYGKYLRCVVGWENGEYRTLDFEISESTDEVIARSMISDSTYVCEP